MEQQKIILATIVVMFSIVTSVNAQNAFTGSVYQPQNTYQPVSPDYSILQRSLQRQESRENEAKENLYELISKLGEVRMKLSPDEETLRWYSKISDMLLSKVQDAMGRGDYSSAKLEAIDGIIFLTSGAEIIERIRTYEEYKGWFESVMRRTDLTYSQKHEWAETYKYKFVPILNSKGQVIGAHRWMDVGGPNNTRVVLPSRNN